MLRPGHPPPSCPWPRQRKSSPAARAGRRRRCPNLALRGRRRSRPSGPALRGGPFPACRRVCEPAPPSAHRANPARLIHPIAPPARPPVHLPNGRAVRRLPNQRLAPRQAAVRAAQSRQPAAGIPPAAQTAAPRQDRSWPRPGRPPPPWPSVWQPRSLLVRRRPGQDRPRPRGRAGWRRTGCGWCRCALHRVRRRPIPKRRQPLPQPATARWCCGCGYASRERPSQ